MDLGYEAYVELGLAFCMFLIIGFTVYMVGRNMTYSAIDPDKENEEDEPVGMPSGRDARPGADVTRRKVQ
jgi:hypothetical protein